MNRIVIVAAGRTPQGRFLGCFAKYSLRELALPLASSLLQRLNPVASPKEWIDHVILGNVLSAGLGMNLARQVAFDLDLAVSCSAYNVNMMCASGIKAIMLGCDAIRTGQARMVLCGGAESMSQAPYLLPRARSGLKLGDATLVDSIVRDGLLDAFDSEPMGISAERLAREYAIDRKEQDEWALLSQQRYQSANRRGVYDAELVPTFGISADEHPRPETTLESLSQLKPAFDSSGTVTAGNASGINDGASLVLLCSQEFARENSLPSLACIDHYTTIGCDPRHMGMGPVHATRKLLHQQGTSLSEFDTVEWNEAFAAQILACQREMPVPADRLNPDGGAIALGHPIGASGARLVVHLAHRIQSGRTRQGLAAVCVGGGMGAALSLSRMNPN